jgi:hypothetical protein
VPAVAFDLAGDSACPYPGSSADTDYDGTFNFYFSPGSVVKKFVLTDGYADCLIPGSIPTMCGSATTRYDVIDGHFDQVTPPEGIVPSVFFPPYFTTHSEVIDTNGIGSVWAWKWRGLLSNNAMAVHQPTLLPTMERRELFGEKVTPLKTTSAMTPPQWLALPPQDWAAYLPIILGKTDACGAPLGSSVVVDSVEKATELLSRAMGDVTHDTPPLVRLTGSLLAVKLNLARAAQIGDPLATAYVTGTRTRVRNEVRRADRTLALQCAGDICTEAELGKDCVVAKQSKQGKSGWHALAACMLAHRTQPWEISRHALLTTAINEGEVVYGKTWGHGAKWPGGFGGNGAGDQEDDQDDGELPCGLAK